MTGRTLLGGMALAVAILFAGALPAQDKDDAKKKQAELMALYLKAATPGPQHKLLEPTVGKWTFTGKFWMDPSQPPTETKGTSVRKWILGGRFVADEIESPDLAGSTFQGFGLTGYDNTQQKFIGLWLDSWSTGASQSVGTVDTSGKVFTYTREEVDPVSKEKVKSRDVIKVESNDRYTMEMYRILPDGKEVKSGEIIATRAK